MMVTQYVPGQRPAEEFLGAKRRKITLPYVGRGEGTYGTLKTVCARTAPGRGIFRSEAEKNYTAICWARGGNIRNSKNSMCPDSARQRNF